jgi:hypothetical protein
MPHCCEHHVSMPTAHSVLEWLKKYCVCGLDSSGSGQRPGAGSCKHDKLSIKNVLTNEATISFSRSNLLCRIISKRLHTSQHFEMHMIYTCHHACHPKPLSSLKWVQLDIQQTVTQKWQKRQFLHLEKQMLIFKLSKGTCVHSHLMMSVWLN